jgi:hypothetical protein
MADGIKSKCDFCDEPAVYDGKTTMGPWAHMCQAHFDRYGIKVQGFNSKLKQQQQPVVTKKCSRCGKEKPVSQFYRYKDHREVERLRPECIECNLAGRTKIRKE